MRSPETPHATKKSEEENSEMEMTNKKIKGKNLPLARDCMAPRKP